MGTRGLVGVRFTDETHFIYQSHDSGPDDLGEEIKNFVQDLQADPFKMLLFTENLRKVEWVNNTSNPTPEQIVKLSNYPELLIHLNFNNDWYTQFPLDALECLEWIYLYELPIIPEDRRCKLEDYNAFVQYAYVIDLNRSALEFYRFNHKMKESLFEELCRVV